MAKISFEITGEDRDLAAALQRMQKEIAKLEEANRKLVSQSKAANKEAKDAAREAEETSRRWVTGIAAVAGGYFTLSGALNAVNAALERQKQLQNDVASRQTALAGAERGYLSNLNGSNADRQSSIQQLQSIARQRGVPLEQAYRSASAGLGFTEGGRGSEVNPAFNVAARFNPYDTEQLTFGLLASQKLTGSTDPMANLGFIKSVQDYSPISNTALVAQNLIPGALGVQSIGGVTDVQAAALVNSISNVRIDPTGQESAGTAQRLARAAKQVFPNLTTDQAIAAAQRDPRIAKKIADKIDNGVTKAAAEQLLFNPNSAASQAYNASKAGIAQPGDRVARAEAAISANESTAIQQVGSLDRTLAAGAESMAVDNSPGARAGVLRQRLQEIRLQAGVGYMDDWFQSQVYERGLNFGASPENAALFSAEFTRREAISGGDDGVISKVDELIGVIKRTQRQNATNDVNTHTEGR